MEKKNNEMICVYEGSSKKKKKLFELFPQLRCHPRKSEEYAKTYLEDNRPIIVSMASSFQIPAKLVAGILYTEMTSSSLGFENADAVSYLKTMITGKSSSIGPGQVHAFHVTGWNKEMTNREAANALYFRDDFGIAASARVISEIYHKLKKAYPPIDSFGTVNIKASVLMEQDEHELWSDVSERYNNGTDGNPYYRKAFEDSLRIIEAFF